MMFLKTFYDYQNNIWRRAVRAFKQGNDPFIIALPGCGKTTILRAFLTHVIKHEISGIKRAVVVTPQNQIKHGFLRRDQNWIVAGAEMEYMQPHHLSAKNLRAFLTGKQTGIAVCCNLALTNPNAKSFNPFAGMDDCNDIVLVIDEAHHMEAPGLHTLISDLKSKGGRAVYATATPFNARGLLTVLTTETVGRITNILYTLGEHMANGHCPKIVLEHRHMQGDAKQISFRGASYNVNDALLWATSISLKWVEDNCPKTLVIIPPTRSGDENKTTHDTAAVLIEELRTLHPNAKILNAVGSDADKTIHMALQAESNGTTDHDIIVACKRFDEGTDVEALCAVYVIGLCSTRLAIQRMGRALRNKKHVKGFAEKHPDYMNQSKMVFFPLPGFELDGTGFAAEAVKMIAAVENYASYNLIVGATKLKGMVRGNNAGSGSNGNGSRGNDSDSGFHDTDDDASDILDSDDDAIEDEIDNVVLKAIMSGTLSPKDLLLLQDAFENNKSVKDVMASASSDMKDLLNAQLLSKALRDPEIVDQVLSILRKSVNKNKAMSDVLNMLAVRFEKEEVEAPNGKSKKDYVTVLGSDVVANWAKIIGKATDNKKLRVKDDLLDQALFGCELDAACTQIEEVFSIRNQNGGYSTTHTAMLNKHEAVRCFVDNVGYVPDKLKAILEKYKMPHFLDRPKVYNKSDDALEVQSILDWVNKNGRPAGYRSAMTESEKVIAVTVEVICAKRNVGMLESKATELIDLNARTFPFIRISDVAMRFYRDVKTIAYWCTETDGAYPCAENNGTLIGSIVRNLRTRIYANRLTPSQKTFIDCFPYLRSALIPQYKPWHKVRSAA